MTPKAGESLPSSDDCRLAFVPGDTFWSFHWESKSYAVPSVFDDGSTNIFLPSHQSSHVPTMSYVRYEIEWRTCGHICSENELAPTIYRFGSISCTWRPFALFCFKVKISSIY